MGRWPAVWPDTCSANADAPCIPLHSVGGRPAEWRPGSAASSARTARHGSCPPAPSGGRGWGAVSAGAARHGAGLCCTSGPGWPSGDAWRACPSRPWCPIPPRGTRPLFWPVRLVASDAARHQPCRSTEVLNEDASALSHSLGPVIDPATSAIRVPAEAIEVPSSARRRFARRAQAADRSRFRATAALRPPLRPRPSRGLSEARCIGWRGEASADSGSGGTLPSVGDRADWGRMSD